MSGDMAQQVETMDTDCIDSVFDNKENTFNHNNVLPCTEKGYEEIDVSELNRKLRYSNTPTASAMSKSFTNCVDHKSLNPDDTLNNIINEPNLTRSLNCMMTKNETFANSFKTLPLQLISTDKIKDKNNSELHQFESTINIECNNPTLTVTDAGDIDENISLSSMSSASHTPQATTPTKESKKIDNGSPIMRGLKSVLNMFRSSQSPIPPVECSPTVIKDDTLSTPESKESLDNKQVLSSTPIPTQRLKEGSGSKRSSPYKESIIFNDDLEKELQWKDETTIIFSQEKIPVHKLFFQHTKTIPKIEANEIVSSEKLNTTVECMDISYNEAAINDKIVTYVQTEIIKNENSVCNDSDSEFLDCETTFNKNEFQSLDNEETEMNEEHIIGQFNSTLDNKTFINKCFDDNQYNIDSKTESAKKCISAESILNSEFNKTDNLVNDSLEINVNKESSVAESKTPDNNIILQEILLNSKYSLNDQLLNSSVPLQSDNIVNINKNETSLSENEFINISPEYELDSLECHVKATSYMGMCNDVLMGKINESHPILPDQTLNAFVRDDNFVPPAEVPLPDDDIYEKEQNITNKLLNDSLYCTEKNINLENNILNETINFSSDVTDKDVSLENKPPLKVDIFPVSSTDVGQLINIALITKNTEDTKEEVGTILENYRENIENPSESNNVLFSPQDHTCDITAEILESVSETNLPENHTVSNCLKEQNKVVDLSLHENNSRLQAPAHVEQDEVLPSYESRVSIDNNYTVESGFIINDQNKFLRNENNTKTIDETQNVYDIIVSSHLDEAMLQQIKHTQQEINVTSISAEKIVNKTVGDTTILSGVNTTEESVTNEQALSDSFQEQSKQHATIIEDKEIVLKSIVPSEVTLNNMEDYKTKFDANKNIEEIEKENKNMWIMNEDPQNSIEGLIVIQTMDDVDSNKDQKHVKSYETFDDNTTVDVAAESHTMSIKKLSDQYFTKSDDVNENQTAHIILKNQELHNTIQRESENKNLNTILLEEVELTETIKSNVILNTTHNETLNSLSDNMTLELDKPDHNTNSTNDIIKNKEQIDLTKMKNEMISVDVTLTKNKITDALPFISNTADNDVNVCELNTVALNKEIVLSENNCPYVLASAGIIKVSAEQTAEPYALMKEAATTMSIASSPIKSKGYNFNFDEIEDPFAMNTNKQILSGTLNENIQSAKNEKGDRIEIPKEIAANERKISHFEKRKQFSLNKKVCKTFDCEKNMQDTLSSHTKNDTNYSSDTENTINDSEVKEELKNNPLVVMKPLQFFNNTSPDNSNVGESIVTMLNEKCTNIILNSKTENESSTEKTIISSCIDHENHPSSDQSSYSAYLSSDESMKPRNVFNLPEIDDLNFNTSTVRSKLCQLQPPSLDNENPFDTKNKALASDNSMHSHEQNETQCSTFINVEEQTMKDCEDKMDTEVMEKNTTVNISIDTCSDKNTTVREINTEDEDTLEGPFLQEEDLDHEKMFCLNGENIDMMPCNQIPATESEDNAELFIDAEAFEFFLNKNKNVVSDSGRESLFLKFDPLFANRMSSDSFYATHGNIQKRQSTPTKLIKQVNMPSMAGPSSLNITYEKDVNDITGLDFDDLNANVSKPTMVVPPALNVRVTPRKSLTPTRTNRRSIMFTSPAMAVIDRLLSLSANNSLVEQETSFAQTSHEQKEADLALTQLRELLAEKEIHVYRLRSENKELKDKLTVLESHINTLETQSEQKLKKINEFVELLSEKTKENRSMGAVVEEYERTIASLITETEQDKKRHAEERIALINERDEQTTHLANMEVSFNDLHSKYEKSKQVILNYEANMKSANKTLMLFEENVTKIQKNYEILKQHATLKLNHANEELQEINRAHEAEVLKLNAKIKRKDLHISSLEETLAQKTKENKELTAICDELLNKV